MSEPSTPASRSTRTLERQASPAPSRAPLREPAFLRLWGGATASGLATWSMPFVLGLAVLHDAITPAALGLTLATRTAGFLLAVPVGGVLADRHSRRAVVFWAGLAAAVASPALAWAIGTGSGGGGGGGGGGGWGWSTGVMAVAGAVVGAGQGACRPAFQALTAEVVAPASRQRANAAMTLAVRVTTLGGPGLAALLATVLPVSTLLLGTGVLWLTAALLPPPGASTPGASTPGATTPDAMTPGATTPCGDVGPARSGGGVIRGFAREFAEGVREARRHPWFLGGLGALTAVIATGYSATAVALPLVSRERYDTEAVLAAAATAYAVGALLGALVIARWRPRSQGWAALAALACYGFAPLSLWLPVPAVAVVAAYVVAGVGIELFNVPWFTATQREVEPRRLARVSSLDFMLSYGLAPVGLALIAPAIDAFGAAPVLATCAFACFLTPLAVMVVPTARHFSRHQPR
ncbi:MFS transporter [Streptomyces sp. 4N509B]|uniref:MFS transporter n=1 Tax=Streptomyces sp. 4N509B TaxID=3457413 RepID=UPI003FD03B6D